MGLEALLRGWVSRALPQAETDNDPGVVRLARYGEVYGVQLVRKQHALCDEGSYFVAHNAQTAIPTSLLGTAFSQTTLSPTLIITNSDSPSNLNNKRIHLDFCHLFVTAVGVNTTLTNLLCAWSVDSTDRYSLGGTDLSSGAASGGGIVNPNTDVAARGSVARIRFGALTLNAASGNSRIITPQRQLRNLNSATALCAIQDHMIFNFGGVELPVDANLDLSGAKTTAGRFLLNIPPITIGPSSCAILHLWSPGQALTTAISFIPELAWWER